MVDEFQPAGRSDSHRAMTDSSAETGSRLPIVAGVAAVAARLRRRRLSPPTPEQRAEQRMLIGVVAIAFLVLVGSAIVFLDAASVPWARGLPPGVAAVFRRLTRFGQSDWLLIPTGLFVVLLLIADWRRVPPLMRFAWAEIGALVGYFFFAVAIAGLLTDLIKWVIGRSRPMLFAADGILTFHPFSFGYAHASFPSGHATTVAAATVVIALISRRWAIPVAIFAATIAMSRVAVGAHYPSDVIAGLFIGATYAYGLAVWLAGKGVAFRRDRKGRIRPRAGALRRVVAAPSGAGAMLAVLAAAIGAAFAPARRAPP
jgi:membrane-associated phospholipid phosphatase